MLTDPHIKHLDLTITRCQSHSILHLCEISLSTSASTEVPVYTEQVVSHLTLRHKKHEMHNVTVINLSLICCTIMKINQPLYRMLLSPNHSIVSCFDSCAALNSSLILITVSVNNMRISDKKETVNLRASYNFDTICTAG